MRSAFYFAAFSGAPVSKSSRRFPRKCFFYFEMVPETAATRLCRVTGAPERYKTLKVVRSSKNDFGIAAAAERNYETGIGF